MNFQEYLYAQLLLYGEQSFQKIYTKRALANGASALEKLGQKEVEGVETLTFVYWPSTSLILSNAQSISSLLIIRGGANRMV